VQGLKSRAAFKLLELDSKYHLFRRGKGQVVVDLGYAPGSWSQVAIDRTAPNGTVVGIDIIPAQPPKGVSAIQGNFLSAGVQGMVKQFLLEGEKKRRAERVARRAAQKEEEEEAVKEEGGEGEEAEAVNEIADRPSYIDLERMAAAQEAAAGDGSLPAASPSASRPTEDSTAKEPETKEKANLRLVDVRAPSLISAFQFHPTLDPDKPNQLTPSPPSHSPGSPLRHVSTLAPDPRLLHQQFE
jgi:21S rRNA (uridine2791-2'-O)-methyltransferase